jgi:hypothetical protein
MWIVAPLPPHRVHRADRRSMSLDASAPHRMMSGTSAAGERCWQRSQQTHSHGVTRRRSAFVAPAAPFPSAMIERLAMVTPAMPAIGNVLHNQGKLSEALERRP